MGRTDPSPTNFQLPSSVTINSTAATKYLSSTDDRESFILQNMSTNAITLLGSSTRSTGAGIRLFEQDKITFDTQVPKGDLWAIASSTDASLQVQRFYPSGIN